MTSSDESIDCSLNYVAVQTDDFDLAHEYQCLRENSEQDGAIALFVGQVRDFNASSPQDNQLDSLYLEHYPGMTEKALSTIVQQARQRWPVLSKVRLIHRVGELQLLDQIVLVGVTSPHREAAFDACRFIMDYLKTQAPFWKRETNKQGQQQWVKAHEKDNAAVNQWRIQTED